MTSPSWPVSTRPSLPFIAGRLDEQDVAAGAGHARGRWPRRAPPCARPPRGRTSGARARRGPRRASTTTGACAVPEAIRVAVLRSTRAQLALELADARLARVLAHDVRSTSSTIVTSSSRRPLRSTLARPQVAAGDGDLLVGRVAVEADDLHAVEQRRRDRLGHVGGGDEQDLRQVELDVQVVVAERVVLRGVQHLEQGRARVAAPVGADLVDLVEHDHRVHRAGVAQGAHQPARQRADVGAPVAADLGLVAHAAQRHADELAPGRAGDRLADRGLAGAGRADQGQDRAGALVLGDAALLAQLAHGQVLGDAVLDVVEARRGRRRAPRARAPGRAAPRSAWTTARRAASRGRCGSSRPRRTARPCARAGPARARPARAPSSGMPASSILARYSSTTEASSSPSSLRMESICLRRKYSRCCFSAPDWTSSRMRLRTCSSASRSRWSSSERAQALGDVERLEQLDLLLEGQVRGVAGGVGQRAGLGDRADEGGDAAVVAAQLEDLLDDRAVLALELAGAPVDRDVVGALLDLARAGCRRDRCGRRRRRRGAGRRASRRGRRRAAGLARRPRRRCRRGRTRSPWRGTSSTRSSSPTSIGQGDVHGGEDDDVVEGDEQEIGHAAWRLARNRLRCVSNSVASPHLQSASGSEAESGGQEGRGP